MSMLKGIETAVYYVKDLKAASQWYTKVLGIQPNYDTPYYVGYTVAGDELGLHPSDDGRGPGDGGQTAYWSVGNIEQAVAHFVAHGAKPKHKVTEVGGGVLIGSVTDPFGNEIGLIQNPTSPNR